MFPVCLEDVLMKHQAVDDGEDAVDAVDCHQNNEAEVTGGDDQLAEGEDDDKGNRDRSDISCKAAGLFTEVEDVEYDDRDSGDSQQHRINVVYHIDIDPGKSSEEYQAVATGNPINTIHEVVSIDNTGTEYQPDNNIPPGQSGKQSPFIKHQRHSCEVHY